MNNKRIVIVGGGTAGWLTAGFLKKQHSHIEITLIESPSIQGIGVGESVTPHVNRFFEELGINDKQWMTASGAVHKYANKFINWKTGNGETEYFSFNYPTKVNLLQHEIAFATKVDDLIFNPSDRRTIDMLMHLLATGELDKFDRYFNSQFHYMEKNVSPYDGNQYLLNPLYSQSQHINAECTAEFVKDHIAIPLGVNHIRSLVKNVEINENNHIKCLTLSDGNQIFADLFVDASGFHRILVNQLGWKFVPSKHGIINRAWVCQTDYVNPEAELVNYTQSIAEPCGWRFKIGLLHRMGNGYCYSSSHVDDQTALEHFLKVAGIKEKQPRLMKWTPGRLDRVADGNTVSVGLSSGFTEPLEANGLYTIITCINELNHIIKNTSLTSLDFTTYNKKILKTIDDIEDFINVHYTLSSRSDTDFWRDMRSIGIKENHEDLVYEKYQDRYNTMAAALNGYTLFPEYMWAQLAHAWGLNLSKWKLNDVSHLDLELSRLHFKNLEKKNDLISETKENSYRWLINYLSK
jgi:tryptophan 7-halogenase